MEKIKHPLKRYCNPAWLNVHYLVSDKILSI